MVSTTARSRALVAGLAATATAWCGLASVSAPAQSAPPAEDCKTAYPVSSLTEGQPVTGLTVSSGTTPEEFTGEVLGVLDDGIAFDTDMIMMRLTSPEIDRVGGIWAGMSGSPVYAQDGRLIGAVAYGLAWGTTPVAGVTPFEDMDEHLGTAATRIKVSDSVARTIAARTDVDERQAAEGFRALPVKMSVTGVPQRALRKHGRDYLTRASRAAGSAADASGPADLVAGGNLGVTWAYGDVIGGGVGTVTSVCDGRVVGFGHPANFFGSSEVQAMNPASAIYVQEDPVGVPFKVANFGAPAGSIDGDHLTGVAGSVGVMPDSGSVTSTWTYGSRSRTGSTDVYVPRAMPSATFYQMAGNAWKVLDSDWFEGTSDTSYTITGTGPDGAPFELHLGNKYTSTDLIYAGLFDVPDLIWFLGYRFPEAEVHTVTHEADVTDNLTTYALAGVEQKVRGTWVAIKKRDRAVVRAGKTLKLRTVLDDGSGDLDYYKFSADIPRRAAGSRGTVHTSGGQSYWGWVNGSDFDKVLGKIAAMPRSDQVVAAMELWGSTKRVKTEWTSSQRAYIVTGDARVRVRVVR